MILSNKRILLLVSGGIAIYKSLDLISALKKEGAEIFVVMSEEATKFIAPLTFEAMSGNKVLCKSTESFPQISHISYANLADIAILAPASVNSIAKLTHGIADSLIIETLLACKCAVFIAPSANVNMLESAQNRANMDLLEQMGYHIIPPRTSLLACNIIANGAMAEVCEIIFHLKRAFCVETNGYFWRDKNVIISGGGSVEKIDAIRHISNDSSGKQASNLALAFYFLGANVSLISSKFPLNLPLGVKKIAVKSSAEFQEKIENELDLYANRTKNAESAPFCHFERSEKSQNRDSSIASQSQNDKNQNTESKNTIFISAAAISDYLVAKPAQGKLKKEHLGKEWDLHLIQNTDILAQISSKFGDSCYIVGFKAESNADSAILNAKKMLDSKGCDMVVLNVISESNQIGRDSNEVRIFTRESSAKIPQDSKLNISFKIAQNIAKNLVKK
ncbi:bifunctional phosphopantothenoylcysteine decarboxylase/phosphopantothenate--cysteine ligase CoaBC [Helicobacter sp. 23-1044]